ncbi:class D beta-lactamase [Xylophilus sp. Kf1]|nr:class D beta-lactamase [Xylophilus sp. Kf1]
MRYRGLAAWPAALATVLALGWTPVPVRADTLCTVIADAADGRLLLEQGDCRTRVTPASTFKIPLAVIGFESGYLTSPHAPVLHRQPGDPDWGGDAWRQPTDPTRWLKYSVVWYSQRIAHALGEDTLHRFAQRFGYGNADFSGDPGQNNGLDRAWIMSSLKVSPVEQVVFLRKLVDGSLPVGAAAVAQTRDTVETFQAADGTALQGKTGTAFPRRPDGSFDESRAYGWFVGWTLGNGQRLVFARLRQDNRTETTSAGLRARDGLLRELPGLRAGFQ